MPSGIIGRTSYRCLRSRLERGTVRLEPLVSDVLPLVELKAAIGMLGSDNATRMKIIMEHNKVE